ncbi:MobH family relaxase [Massilia sp. TS11]|uniref:MobH family relaxase n=1 Tax=Massilia sp. TS11 TaxID=2908003 RepID=UPI001EDB3698|nr:MobH family relaxase [Massilia sp. TS11]MCG2583898.1 TraI domain-containing protein [Massilia sp. TS11]
MRFLRELFAGSATPTQHADPCVRVEPVLGHGAAASAGAPSFVGAKPAAILGGHADWITRVRLAFGIEPALFDERVMPLLHNLARYVNQLPATPDAEFSEPGGLFRLSLATAFFALQGADGQIFTGQATISDRKKLEEKWRLATFLAGLCAELHRALRRLRVVDAGGKTWSPYLVPLSAWLAEREPGTIRLNWSNPAAEARATAVFAVPIVVPASTLAYLAEDGDQILPHCLAAISGVPLWGEHNIVAELVRDASIAVHAHEQQLLATSSGRAPSPTYWARHLVEAAQALARSSAAWEANGAKSRVHLGCDGLYLLWPEAGADLIHMLDRRGFVAVPKSTDTLADLLLQAGVLSARPDGHTLWHIRLPGQTETMDAVKLNLPDILLASVTPRPEALRDALHAVPTAGSTQAPGAPAASSPAPATAVQLALPGMPSRPDNPAPPAPPAPDPEKLRLQIALRAPARLNRQVALALHAVVETLGRKGSHRAALLVEGGLVVTENLFKRARIDPGVALRALREADMLLLDAAGAPVREPVGDGRTGMVIAACHIDGLNAHLQATMSDTRGASDAS